MVDVVLYHLYFLTKWTSWWLEEVIIGAGLSIFSQLLTDPFEYGKKVEKKLGFNECREFKRNIWFPYEKMAVYCNLILTMP
jgi:hypothetical protein